MTFVINIDGKFNRKEILVADYHTIEPPPSVTYSSVVSRESIINSFLLASLDGLEIFACNIGNTYPNAKFRDKLFT